MNSNAITFHQSNNILPTNINHPTIIKPDIEKLKKRRKTSIFVVDSRERNMQLFPNPSKYTIHFNEDYRSVVKIELIEAMVPKSGYMINNTNHNIYIHKGIILENSNTCIADTSTTITLLNGDYCLSTDSDHSHHTPLLTEMLNNKLLASYTSYTSHTSNSPFTVYYLPRINKIIFKTNFRAFSSTNYNKDLIATFDFDGGLRNYNGSTSMDRVYRVDSCGEIMGFPPGKYSGMLDGHVVLSSIAGSDITLQGGLGDKTLDGLFSGSNGLDGVSDPTAVKTIVLYETDSSPIKYHFCTISGTSPSFTITYAGFQEINGSYISSTPAAQLTVGKQYKLIIDYIEPPNTISLVGENYALIKIPICKNLKSNETNIKDTFAKIPLTGNYWLGFNSDALSLTAKNYNPPLPTLGKFDISFHTFDKKLSANQNTLYDFNGRDHVLVFAITTLFQQSRYLEFNET